MTGGRTEILAKLSGFDEPEYNWVEFTLLKDDVLDLLADV